MAKVKYNYDDYIGRKIGKWTINGYISGKYNKVLFKCTCECGKESNIVTSKLIHNKTLLCKRCAAIKHGFYKTPTYTAWNGARNRCFNPNNKNYKDYGARGITMCERWNNFLNFLQDMGEKPTGLTLDRINNNGNYEPNNCRWATISQQNSNQRKRTIKSKGIEK